MMIDARVSVLIRNINRLALMTEVSDYEKTETSRTSSRRCPTRFLRDVKETATSVKESAKRTD